MDNYFSKFLCKHPKATSKYQHHSDEAERESNSKDERDGESSPRDLLGGPFSSRNKVVPNSTSTSTGNDGVDMKHLKGGTEASIPSLFSLHSTSPFPLYEIEQMSDKGFVLNSASTSLTPPLRSPSTSHRESTVSMHLFMKYGREDKNEKDESESTPQRRRVEPSSSSSITSSSKTKVEVNHQQSLDDEDDLFLLLGSQEARRQIEKEKTVEAPQKVIPSPSCFPFSSASSLTPRRIRDLPWNSSRNALRSIARCFSLQLEVEMSTNPLLLEAFAPFLKKRVLEKVDRSRREQAVVSPASTTFPTPLSWLPHPMDLPEDSWVNGTEEFISNPYREVVASESILESPPDKLDPDVVNPPISSPFLPGMSQKKKEDDEKVDYALQSGEGPSTTKITTVHTGTGNSFTLRPYQIDGVHYLLNHFHWGLSCVLSDDMGLGKTAQVASFLHVLWVMHHVPGPHLIVCPMSTITNWVRELNRWAPELKVMKYHGNRKDRNHQKFCSEESGNISHNHHHFSIVVTTPAILNQDKGFFLRRPWVVVAVDEAHVLKNSNTRITSLCRKLTACFRLAVTGTPIQNNIQEVFSILGFLFPSITVMEGNFDDDDPATAVTACAKILSHLMLRRTKNQLLLGLPPRIDHPVTMLEPTFVQQELLRWMSSGALEEDRDALLQGHLTHQRMVCSHPLSLKITARSTSGDSTPYHADPFPHSTSGASSGENRETSLTEDGRGKNAFLKASSSILLRLKLAGIPLCEETIIHCSAKMRYLDRELPRLQKEGHRCLIFSNFASVLDLLEGFCVLRGYSYERLDGTCSRVERELSLLRFNNASSSCFLFLITTSAGGVGLTLTGADTVFLFDANFNPQLDRQAADRAHRIGQTRDVHVYRLCLANTLEEYIREVSEYKASLGDMIVVHASGGGTTIGHAGDTEGADGSTPTSTAGATSIDAKSGTTPLTSPSISNSASFSSSRNVNFNFSGQEIRKFLEKHQQLSRRRFEESAGCPGLFSPRDAPHNGPSAVEHTATLAGVINMNEDETPLITTTTTNSTFSSNPPSNLPTEDSSGSHTSEGVAEKKLVEELLSLERGNDREMLPYGSSRRQTDDTGVGGGGLAAPMQTHICFVCGERMHKMEPLYHCSTCPKAYHAECVGEPKPKPGYGVAQRHWTCPRHRCFTCDKVAVSSDGAIFMCYGCPRAYCFDCLPSFFLELEDKGEELRYVHRTYEGMEKEGVRVRKSCYYLECLHCAGVECDSSSSSASSTDSSELDEEEEGDGEVEELIE